MDILDVVVIDSLLYPAPPTKVHLSLSVFSTTAELINSISIHLGYPKTYFETKFRSMYLETREQWTLSDLGFNLPKELVFVARRSHQFHA